MFYRFVLELRVNAFFLLNENMRPQRLKFNAILKPLLLLFLFRIETLNRATATTTNQKYRPYVLFSTFRFDTFLLPYAMVFQVVLCIGNNCDVCNVLYYYMKCAPLLSIDSLVVCQCVCDAI